MSNDRIIRIRIMCKEAVVADFSTLSLDLAEDLNKLMQIYPFRIAESGLRPKVGAS